MRRAALIGALVCLALVDAGPTAAAPGVVRAYGSLSPNPPYLFGQQVRATVDLVVKRARVDPASVGAVPHFAPFELVGEPERSETDEGLVTRIRYRYLLTCDSLGCAKGLETFRSIAFEPLVARYRTLAGDAHVVRVRWADFRLVSRVGDTLPRPGAGSTAQQILFGNPLQVVPLSVAAPSATYSARPRTLALVLFAAALAALLGAAGLARPLLAAALRRGGGDAGPELSALERALERVEDAARREPGTPEHRESLALLARELRRADLGTLAGDARRLAWSEHAPTAPATRELARAARESNGARP